MNTTCCSNATRPDPYAPADFQYTKFNRASVELRASAGISLVTADGDKVTLNASSSIQAGLQTYDYFGRTRGQTVAARGEELQLATSNGYAVTVEGKLDQAELADIRQLISTLSSVSKDFFAGNSQDGLQHLAQLDDLDSIASFKASFNYTRQVSAVAASQISSTAAAQAQETAEATRAAATNSSQAATPSLTNYAGSLIGWSRTVILKTFLNDSFNYSKNSPTNCRWTRTTTNSPRGSIRNTRDMVATSTDQHNNLLDRLQTSFAQTRSRRGYLKAPTGL